MVLGAGSAILCLPLVYVQLTRFTCGEFIVTARFSHRHPLCPRPEPYRSRVPPQITFAHHEYMHVYDPRPKFTNEP